MDPFVFLILILMLVVAWFWGFTEGRERPTAQARSKMVSTAIHELQETAEQQAKKLGYNIAQSRKEEIYVRYAMCTYIQKEILALPDFDGTAEDALSLAVKIVADFLKQNRQAFDENFKDGVEQATMEIMHGK